MKAISIQNPWAWLIVRPDVVDPERRSRLRMLRQIKDVENRKWATAYRGRVLIHTGKKMDIKAHLALRTAWESHFPDVPRIHLPDNYDFSGIIGMATVVDCVAQSDSPWFFGPFGFVLTASRPLPFHPCPGKLGFFNVDYQPALTEVA